MLLYGSQDLSVERAIVLFSYLSYLSQELLREPDSERFDLIFHTTILSSNWLRVKRGKSDYVARLRGPVPLSKKEEPFIPISEERGFLARFGKAVRS
jgi:hypothetical protein